MSSCKKCNNCATPNIGDVIVVHRPAGDLILEVYNDRKKKLSFHEMRRLPPYPRSHPRMGYGYGHELYKNDKWEFLCLISDPDMEQKVADYKRIKKRRKQPVVWTEKEELK